MNRQRNMLREVLVLSVVVCCSTVWGFSGGGSGTEANPYMITTVEQLQEMQNDLTAWYELGNDIDASETASWNGGQGFMPVGWFIGDENYEAFSGYFNGNGHEIYGLYINRPNQWHVGLFGYVRYSEGIKNVILTDVNITGQTRVGPLIGRFNYSTISNCWSSGLVMGVNASGNTRIGGLVGVCSSNSTLQQCYSIANVTGTGDAIGGLAGYNGHGSIVIDCYALGNVKGSSKVGGLIGDNTFGAKGGYVARCYSTGRVTGSGGGNRV